MMKKHLYFKLFLSLFLFVFLFPLILVADAECIGDLNGDLQVNYNDLVIFAMPIVPPLVALTGIRSVI